MKLPIVFVIQDLSWEGKSDKQRMSDNETAMSHRQMNGDDMEKNKKKSQQEKKEEELKMCRRIWIMLTLCKQTRKRKRDEVQS